MTNDELKCEALHHAQDSLSSGRLAGDVLGYAKRIYAWLVQDETEALIAAIAHGDEKHRAWLAQAVKAFYADKPIPPRE